MAFSVYISLLSWNPTDTNASYATMNPGSKEFDGRRVAFSFLYGLILSQRAMPLPLSPGLAFPIP